MTSSTETPGLADALARELPLLRRYARALTGHQGSGDAYAAATLEAVLEDRSVLDGTLPVRVAIYQVFHSIWATSGSSVSEAETSTEATAQAYLGRLTAGTREALLLATVEEFPIADVAKVMQVTEAEAHELVAIARSEMADLLSGKVLIIEDEAIIAMDLEAIVSDLGHRITGVARTHADAVDLAVSDPPDLILADIQLADNSSGMEAVADISGRIGDRPVIFITAFPERLLTGEGQEPAFLISKPYSDEQVRTAISQAMFFAPRQG
ncbi:MAG: response regulator [Pseudomonadota bacterium]